MIHPTQNDAWDRFKDTAARRWPKLTEAELDTCLSDDWQLVALIQDRYGLNRREAVAEVLAVQTAAKV